MEEAKENRMKAEDMENTEDIENTEKTEKTEAEAEKAREAAADRQQDAETEKEMNEASGKAGGAADEKKTPEEKKIAELEDKVKRQMAEFENFRRRTEKEKSRMYDIGASDVVEKLLPVLDNFERAMQAVPAEEKTSFSEGMDLILKQMEKMLADLGVEAIPAEGQQFDPALHNAIMHTEDESLGENVVVKEFQKGYSYKGNVIRHSMVSVAN